MLGLILEMGIRKVLDGVPTIFRGIKAESARKWPSTSIASFDSRRIEPYVRPVLVDSVKRKNTRNGIARVY